MAAGITVRQGGASVVLVERATLGGTCVNVGCVPSKTLLAAAGARHTAATHPFAGVTTSADGVDLAALVAQKNELTAGLRQAKYADVAAAYGFAVVAGQARFRDEETLEADGRMLPARSFVIATGSQPRIPDLPGLKDIDFLTSTTAMELDAVPASLIVIGGGYVGMEQAQLFAHLGARVTVVGRLAPDAEPELAAILREVFTDDGITVLEEHAVAVEAVSGSTVGGRVGGRVGGGVRVRTESGHEVIGDRVLIATGRGAQTDGLDLPAAGVATDERGFIRIDAHQATSNPRVFAAGDVAGTPQYVYVAAASGRVAATNALAVAHGAAGSACVDYTGLPGVVFTRPQLASAGLTEKQALAAGRACVCRVLDLSDVPRALVNRDTRGAVKVVADVETGRVLGVHALAEGAGEMMLAATYAIKAQLTVDDLADTWAPYLTMAESLRIAAGQFRNELPTSCCA